MALQKQILSIPFVGGQDTKTDPKQGEIFEYEYLNNVTYQTIKEAKKRYGYERKGTNTTLSTTNTVDEYMRELVTTDGESVYSLSEVGDEMTEKGSKVAIQVASEDVVTTIYDQSGVDQSVNASFSVLAWNDSSGGTRYSVLDQETGNRIVDNALLSATGNSVRVVRFSTYTLIFYYNGTDLVYRSIADATPETISAEVTVITGAYANVYDAQVISTRCFIAYRSGSDIGFKYLDTSLVLSAETLVVGVNSFTYISLFGDTSNNVWCTYNTFAGPTFTVEYLIRSFTLTAVLAPTVIETTSTLVGDYQFPVGIYDGTNGRIFYGTPDELYRRDSVLADPVEFSLYEVKTATCTVGGVVTGPTVVIKSVSVASRPIIVSGTIYLMVTHGSEFQSTYFMISSDGKTHMKVGYGLGGGMLLYDHAPELILVGGIYYYPYLKRRVVGAESGEVADVNGISVATIDFGALIPSESMAQNLHLGGGILSMYDGQSIAEHGFNLFPEGVTTQWVPAQGALYAGTYQYSVTYEWTDSQGQIHRSAPSEPVSIQTDSEEFTDVAVNIVAASPNLTVVSGLEKVPLFQRGMGVETSPNFPANSRISDVAVPNIINANANATGTSGPQTATVTPTMPIQGDFGFATKEILFHQFNDFTMSGKVSDDGTQVEMADASPLAENMRLTFQGTAYTITAISGNTVTLSVPLGGAVWGMWVTFYAQIFASVSTVALNNNVTGVPSWFIDTIRVGTRIFASAFPDPTYVTSVGVGQFTVDNNATITSGSSAIAAGFSPKWVLKTGQVISGTGIQPGTKITEVINPEDDFDFDLGYGPTMPTITAKIDLATSADGTLEDLLIETFTGTALEIPTLRITDKPDNNPVSIVVYRTLVNQTVFYRVTSFEAPLVNDKTVDKVTFFDNKSDQDIQGNSVLYTTGGVLENIAAPAAYSTGSYKNRVMLVPADDRQSVWFSQPVVSGAPVEFSDLLVIRAPETGGDCVAVAQLDDKLIIFKERAIFVTGGDGPSFNGLNNDYGYPQIISSDVGCVEPRSIVTTPDGLMFKSAKGIYLLSRGLQVAYIGSPVESDNSATVTSATLIKDQNHIRFSLDSGKLVVYDYLVGKWITHTGLNARDACIWQGVYTLGMTNGHVWSETVGSYTDNGAFIPIQGKTSWFSLAELQGYERIYKLLALGEYHSPHTLRFKVYKDFETAVVQNTPIDVLSAPTDKYQYRLFMTVQKCEALQFEFLEEQAGPSYGQGLSLSAFALELGIKGKLNRMKAAASYG